MDRIEKIFKSVIYCTLSTVCEDGTPWSTPVFFSYDGQKSIYWWSPIKAVHSKNIVRNQQVFITVFDSRVPEGEGQGIYIKATAKILEEPVEIKKAIEIYNSRSKVFKLSLQNSSGKAPTRIFVAKPDEIWANVDNEENGYFIDTREQLA